ncbi:MAG: hypothetical protein CMH54_07175 [Myxococcales bacterium]|nr:hypothetical protein [Myxococcales bacterium]|tara:strand:+ start:1448 stop:2152 length:705 start_codon:yes stop_codon:yes gene_type:complete
MSRKAFLVLALFLFSSTPLFAQSGVKVFMNGKEVTGARNLKLKDVMVHFDQRGNLHINAPKYNINVKYLKGVKVPVKPAPQPVTPPTPAVAPAVVPVPAAPAVAATPRVAPQKRYYVAAKGQDASILGCQISVWFGGVEVSKFNGLEATPFAEITDKLSAEQTQLSLRCRRPPGAVPNSEEIDPKKRRDAFFEVEVGYGTLDGTHVTFEKVLGTIRCTDRTGGFAEKQHVVVVE